MSVGGWRPRRWHGRASRCLRSARRSRIRRATADTVSQRSMSTWPRIHSSPGRGSRGAGAFLRLAPRRSLASSSRHGLQRARTVLRGTETTHGRLDMALVKVNGRNVRIDGPDDMPLLWALRDILGMTGTKFGCGMALCGACTVHVDGGATRSCVTPIDSIGTSEIATIEAIGATAAGANIQKAWLDREVVQCGYCQSGQIMSATALLASNPHPTDSDIDGTMSGNICRCGTYIRIREAIKQAAQSTGQRS